MPARKKKATFYLPEDLLRVARVHAARTDRRDSQVVEDALRTYLGYGNEESPWESEVDPPAAGEAAAPESGAAPVVAAAPPEPAAAAPEPVAAAEPPPPLDPDEALSLAITELHALRVEDAGGR